ncbi:unnamed protein product [Rhizoctonia solani]|uniref:Guanylate-binding protein N-terminal domain-containing protein n=1 Tax=Rhizoctonia solani TaxID=456999 RepID=A0A8H3GPW3_9AGAM|nr:unnamed protein product [Rhizoctonia solani]
MVAEAHKNHRDALNGQCGSERQSQLKVAFDTLVKSLRESMKPSSTDRPQICLESVTYLRGYTGHWLSVKGVQTILVPSQNQYGIYPLELTEHDRHRIHEDEAYIPQPRLTRNTFTFSIPIDHSIEFMRLIGEKCLLVISDNTKGQTRIYFEDNIALERSINTSGKVTLYHSQLGSLARHFAFDETTRQLAIIHGQEDLRLSIFMFDELLTNLRKLGSPIFLREWYKDPPVLASICFQSGRISPELCFVETSGRIRIFSLKTQMFRGAELELGRPVSDAFPAPDGSCFLAITMNNKFMPLKDGVWDPEHERKLVGATISELIDSLSLGWYESLLQSYMATKPVRVVSSMGEQSVGKSYCLNHFADTSFAGSAMRTTEGIWLSCTPTREYLLISLDFEGMQSIERSPQEDMLLVLFNTAISNLVLFRNNFALSRNIAGLFTSFQLSARTFDPSRNPTLFNSNLAIIIKDVTDGDSRNIVQEFALRFREIVQLERDRNFITQLHRGKLQIIPWPVINSSAFYSLFGVVKQRLDQQPFTHQTGGAFLHKLKTLLIKIKTSNWDAMDQSLASSRAQHLKERLQNALSSGITMEGPLKNMDTDEDIPTLENQPIFFVPSFGDNENNGENSTQNEKGEYDSEGKLEEITEVTLRVLIERCGPPLSSRPHMADRNYVEALQENLYQGFECRKNLVQTWIHENTKHLSPENAGLRDLHGLFNVLTRAMKAAPRSESHLWATSGTRGQTYVKFPHEEVES